MNAITQLLNVLQASMGATPASDTTESSTEFATLFGALLEHAQDLSTGSEQPSAEDLLSALQEDAELAAGLLIDPSTASISTIPISLGGENASMPPQEDGLIAQSANQTAEAKVSLSQSVSQSVQSVISGMLQKEGMSKETSGRPITVAPTSTAVAQAAVVDELGNEESPTSNLFAKAVAQQESQQGTTPSTTPIAIPELSDTGAAAAKPTQPFPTFPAIPQSSMPPGVEGALAQGESIAARQLPAVVEVREVGDFAVRTVRYLAGRTEETVTVRLVPRSLGELHIVLRSSADSLELVLTAANQAARDTLEMRIPELKEALLRDGFDVTKVTVQTFSRGESGDNRFGPETSGHSGQNAKGGPQRESGRESGETPSRASPQSKRNHDGNLNTFV